MKSSPPTLRLDDIAEFTNGGAWNQEEYSDSGIPVTRVSDIHGGTVDLSSCKFLPESCLAKYSKNQLQEGDLIICTVGSHPTQPGSVVGRAGIVPRSANGSLLNQNAVCVRPKTKQIDKRWLGYIGKSESFHDYIKAHARGSASQVRMAIGLLKEMPVQVPDLPTQRKIADILSAYDDLIANNLRRIKILEEMAQSLYREWFVHFRFPGHEAARFIDSSLGPIPKGWEVKAASEVAQITIGKTPPRQESQWFTDKGDGIPWISIKDMNQGRFVLNAAEGLTDEAVSKFNVRRVPDGTVLLSFKLTVGRVCLTVGEIVTNEAIAHFVLGENSLITSAYLTTYLSNFQFETLGSTSSIGRATNSQVVKQMPILVPHEKIATAFNNLAEPSYSLVRSLMQRNQNLRGTRDLLLPKLLSAK